MPTTARSTRSTMFVDRRVLRAVLRCVMLLLAVINRGSSRRCNFDELQMFCLARTSLLVGFMHRETYRLAQKHCFPHLDSTCQIAPEAYDKVERTRHAERFHFKKKELERNCFRCVGRNRVSQYQSLNVDYTPTPRPYQKGCCMRCEAGKFSNALIQSSVCGTCPRGQYPAGTHTSPCSECPEDTESVVVGLDGRVVATDGAFECYTCHTDQSGQQDLLHQKCSQAAGTFVPAFSFHAKPWQTTEKKQSTMATSWISYVGFHPIKGRAPTPTATPTKYPELIMSLFPTVFPSPVPSSFPTPAPTKSERACSNTCKHSFDGFCEDGGPNAFEGSAVCEMGTDCADCGERSFAPTHIPTKFPTIKPGIHEGLPPTLVPTFPVTLIEPKYVKPTYIPTRSPTSSPTRATLRPTAFPTTKFPTAAPTTPFPTSFPSAAPSEFPTAQPSGIPTLAPTIPTQSPTFTPTAPTVNPTAWPSPTPTVPTTAPTLPVATLQQLSPECQAISIQAARLCADLQGHGYTCVTECVVRVTRQATKTVVHRRALEGCPMLWKRVVHSSICWPKDCTEVIRYICGSTFDEVIPGAEYSSMDGTFTPAYYDGCRACMLHFAWSSPPIHNSGCWLWKYNHGFCEEHSSKAYRNLPVGAAVTLFSTGTSNLHCSPEKSAAGCKISQSSPSWMGDIRGTFAPTNTPTPTPTPPPSSAPTMVPTPPTAVPTPAPTMVPTLPTTVPTPSPPTYSPTALPTATPTASPTSCTDLNAEVGRLEDPAFLQQDNAACKSLRALVDSNCEDVKGGGQVCVQTCLNRMIALAAQSHAMCLKHSRCPVLWRRYIGLQFCAGPSCELEMKSKCGKHIGKILKGHTRDNPKAATWYDACRLCTHHFIWGSTPAQDYGCWLKTEAAFCKPSGSAGALFARFAEKGLKIRTDWTKDDHIDHPQLHVPAE